MAAIFVSSDPYPLFLLAKGPLVNRVESGNGDADGDRCGLWIPSQDHAIISILTTSYRRRAAHEPCEKYTVVVIQYSGIIIHDADCSVRSNVVVVVTCRGHHSTEWPGEGGSVLRRSPAHYSRRLLAQL